MCVACFEALLRIMGLSESKKTYRRENSINPANGRDNPGFGISGYSNNKSNEKSDADTTVVTNLDDKSSRKVDHVKSAMNTECRKRDRAIKLKRTCSKYTALDGKAANEGEIYDIDEQDDNAQNDADKDTPFAFRAKCVLDRPDVCNEELENDSTKASGRGKDMERKEECRMFNCRHEYVDGEEREQSHCGESKGHHQRHEKGVGDNLCSKKFRDNINEIKSPRENAKNGETTRRHKCHSRGKCDDTGGKLSKTFAWPSSELLTISSIANFKSNTTTELSDSYQLVDDNYANGHYVSTSISLPYNNLRIYSTDMKRLELDQKPYTDFHNTTYPAYCNKKKGENDCRPTNENVSLESNVEYEVKSQDKYRLVRYPLRIKVNPYEDVCEVSIPQKMMDELRVSRV